MNVFAHPFAVVAITTLTTSMAFATRAVGNAGDGNGCDDVLVGAPMHSGPAGAQAGKGYVFSGRDGTRLCAKDGEVAHNRVIVSAFGFDGESGGNGGGQNSGKVYVFEAAGGAPSLATLTATGPAPANYRLSGGSDIYQPVNSFVFSPDGQRVAYSIRRQGQSANEIHTVLVDGSAPPQPLNRTLADGDSVVQYIVAPDGSRIVYVTSSMKLYSVPSDGSATETQLGERLDGGFSNGVIESPGFAYSPDGLRVVYRAQDDSGRFALYSVLADGSAAAIKLSGPLAPDTDVDFYFVVSPDSRCVVYLTGSEIDQTFDLYSVPVDGTAAPVKLNGPLNPGSGVAQGFVIAPDGRRVFYLVDDLYSVPIDGSASPVDIGQLLPTKFSTFFRLTPDATHAIYDASDLQTAQTEIYSVPLDERSTPAKLNGPIVDGGTGVHHPLGLEPFSISGDSRRVVYTADQEVLGKAEFYSVPVDGGGASVKLNGDLCGQSLVVFSQISPDSQYFVYVAPQATPRCLYQVFSRRIDGSGSPMQLSGTFLGPQPQPNGFPQAPRFRITPDSRQVVYVADQDSDLVWELYVAPIDGNGAPMKLNGPVTKGVDLVSFSITPDGSRVVYLADQTDVVGLWAASLDAVPFLTPTLTATPTTTLTPTTMPTVCDGNCNGDDHVAVDEVLTLLKAALGQGEASSCALGVPAATSVDVSLILRAVNHAVGGC